MQAITIDSNKYVSDLKTAIQDSLGNTEELIDYLGRKNLNSIKLILKLIELSKENFRSIGNNKVNGEDITLSNLILSSSRLMMMIRFKRLFHLVEVLLWELRNNILEVSGEKLEPLATRVKYMFIIFLGLQYPMSVWTHPFIWTPAANAWKESLAHLLGIIAASIILSMDILSAHTFNDWSHIWLPHVFSKSVPIF
ncbi:hypothetical protein RCL_jg11217.t1 [Rhizophagus clarus]|uniref:Uncharacterized protein n=1 Tax=Rhizophagus clarus TaxID=94130 RepID=A0A8H3M6P0_9GLOM|nr:hypothetical protein RCL_jg11217.t1 [Rhizophagus clarus]